LNPSRAQRGQFGPILPTSGINPFLIVLVMQIYSEIGGGPAEPMRTVYAFTITGFLYFIAGQATIAADREEKSNDVR
jgi:hypothetical protein